MDPNNDTKVDIALDEDARGKHRIVVSIEKGSQLSLTPHQARLLAIQLIIVVNRAEVRGSLRRSPNLCRKRKPAIDENSVLWAEFAK